MSLARDETMLMQVISMNIDAPKGDKPWPITMITEVATRLDTMVSTGQVHLHVGLLSVQSIARSQVTSFGPESHYKYKKSVSPHWSFFVHGRNILSLGDKIHLPWDVTWCIDICIAIYFIRYQLILRQSKALPFYVHGKSLHTHEWSYSIRLSVV